MTTASRKRRWLTRVMIVVTGGLGGAGAMWLSTSHNRMFISPEADGVLCCIDTPAQEGVFKHPFTTSKTIEQFYVDARPARRGQSYTLDIQGDDVYFVRFTQSKGVRFGCGIDVPPGTYTLTVEQGESSAGVRVCVSDRPVGVTGWQILSRGIVIATVLAACWTAWAVRRGKSHQRLVAVYVFKRFVVAILFVVVYLLLHEGGHALAAIAFGQWDPVRSDFFGLHGSPRSALAASAALDPWQRAVVSMSGPLLPIFSGWFLFALWDSARGRRVRDRYAPVDFLLSSIIAGVLLPSIVLPACALNLMSDGDWRGFIENVPGPPWLARGLVLAVFAVSAVLFARVIPHAYRLWREPPLDVGEATSAEQTAE